MSAHSKHFTNPTVHQFFGDVSGRVQVVMKCECGKVRPFTEQEQELFEAGYIRGIRQGRLEAIEAVSSVAGKVYNQDIEATFFF